MDKKMQETQAIIDWYCSNLFGLDPMDQIDGLKATIEFAEKLKPLYEKYNKIEKEGFKILARMDK